MPRKKVILKKSTVFKWITNMQDGTYEKGQGVLTDGEKFCCLGVWADMHGCTWKTHPPVDGSREHEYYPIPKGKTDSYDSENHTTLNKEFLFGLEDSHQGKLTDLNDANQSWEEVIAYIATKILPEAV